METKVLNYRINIEKEKQKKDYKYMAYVPTLGISDFGNTIESATSNVTKAIKIYLETLVDLKKVIPTPDAEEYFMTSTKVELNNLPKNYAF